MARVLSNQGGFYHASVYLEEARRMGLRLLLPDVNRSEQHYKAEYVEDGNDPRRGVARRRPPPLPEGVERANAVRIGLLQVKGLTEATADALLETRGRDGFFTSLTDFLQRVPVRDDELEALVKVGAFDAFEWTRPELLWRVAEARARRIRGGEADESAEGMVAESLPFQAWERPTRRGPPGFLPRVPDWNLEDKIRFEMEHLDLTPSGHPMMLFRDAAGRRGCVTAGDLARHTGRRARVAGWLATSKRVTTRKGEQMRFLTLEDETGMVEVTLFPQAYQRWGGALDGRGPYLVEGRVEEDHGALSLTATRLERLRSLTKERGRGEGGCPW
jgi:DNA polymerase III alpha subunit